MPLKLTLEVTHVNDEKFIVTATLTPKVQSNFTLKNKLVFKFGDKTYIANLTDNGVQNGFYKWTIANATYELYNLSAGHYTISAYYPTDDTHNFVENSTPFNVKKRNTWINVLVNDHVYGNLALAIVNTNGNGTVLLSMNGRTERYDLSKGDGSYEGYNITNGVLYVTFDTLYGPGNYSMAVVYEGDDFYEYALNQTNFTVFKKNTTISAVSTNISFWDAEEINVTVDANASGYIKIKLGDNQEYVEIIDHGVARFKIPNLFPKDYRNVEVLYNGDPYFNGNTTYINFTVGPSGNYSINVTAPDIIYGQNATVYVYVPSLAQGNVTIYVDGIERGYVPVINGVATLNNISGLAGGNHIVNATYHGGAHYSAKNTTSVTLTVKPNSDWKTDITATERPYGENTTVYIDAGVYHLSGKNITLNISGQIYVVNLTDGKCNLTLNNLTAGMHESHVIYDGDANYSAKSQKFFLYIVKAQPTVTLTIEDDVVSANVSGKNVTGNVTFYVNGKTYTVNVTGNIAQMRNLTIGNNSVVAIYNGDANHFAANSFDNYTVARLNSTVNVTAKETVYGNAVEITVTAGENHTGFVKITVNGEIYIAELNNTVAKFYIDGLNVAEYEVNVTYYGDETYANATNSTKFNVTKANVTADVIAQNVTVNQSTAFIIDYIDSDFNGNVSITVDGKLMYNGTLKTLITSNNLLAGNKTAVVTFYGDDNYNDATLKVNFTVSKIDPTIKVSIVDVIYPNNASALVLVSDANGTVEIYLNNTLVGSETVKNGQALVNLTRLSAGAKQVSVRFVSNDNYYNDINTTAKFNVIKAISTVEIVSNGTDVIAVVSPSVTGNVTFYINGIKYENVTVNGNATLKGKLQIGNNSVFVVYSGNENYTGSNNVKIIEIAKLNATVNVTVSPIFVDQTARINITGPADIIGYVIVTVNGVNYSVILNNGIGHVDVKGLGNGTYDVNVTYLENDKYSSAVNGTKLIVSKLNTTVAIEVKNITYGNDRSCLVNFKSFNVLSCIVFVVAVEYCSNSVVFSCKT